jgi:hypothetical protein
VLRLGKSDSGEIVGGAAPLLGKFLASGKRSSAPKVYGNIVPARESEQAQYVSSSRRHMRQAIDDGDGFHMDVRARQEKSDGHQVVGAGVGIHNHGAAERRGTRRRLGGELRWSNNGEDCEKKREKDREPRGAGWLGARCHAIDIT